MFLFNGRISLEQFNARPCTSVHRCTHHHQPPTVESYHSRWIIQHKYAWPVFRVNFHCQNLVCSSTQKAGGHSFERQQKPLLHKKGESPGMMQPQQQNQEQQQAAHGDVADVEMSASPQWHHKISSRQAYQVHQLHVACCIAAGL